MKKLLLFLLTFTLGISAMPAWGTAETGEQRVTVSDQTVIPHGRTYYADGFLWFNWTYSGFSFAFNGTAAKGVFKSGEHNNAYLNVYVDGSPAPVNTIQLKGNERTFTLVEGLPEGDHVVTVRKRTENTGNITAGVKELILTGTLSEQLPQRPAYTVEVVGDSITCGFGNLMDGTKASGNQPKGQDGTRTFATLALQRFDADISVVAKSGIGFAYNHGGKTEHTMQDVYGYTDYYRLGTDVPWDFAGHPSDVVIIALGTNDTSAPSHQAFADGAKAFLAQVREKNPDAIIIWAYEVITASFNTMIQQAVIDANAAGDGKVFYYALGLMDKQTDGVGLDGHPSLTTHIKDAEGFAQFIAGVTGWELQPESTALQIKPAAGSDVTVTGTGLLVAPPAYAGKTVADLKAALAAEDLVFADEAGTPLADTQKVATGHRITRMEQPFATDRRTLCIMGDVNGSGSINAADALEILRHSVGKTALYDEALKAAGVTGAQELSAVDALKVLQYAVGKIEEF